MKRLKKINQFIFLFAAVFILTAALFNGCADENNHTAQNKIYYCPMHPEVTSDKPGVCPICQMDLVLKGNDYAMEGHTDEAITISDRKQVLANISVVKVSKEEIVKEITAYSYLDFAEQNKKLITAKFNGRIEKLFIDKTGDYIRKGDPLFEIYSPDLVQAQNDYLIASNGLLTGNFSGNKNDDDVMIKSAEQKLLLMGLTQKQIDELRSNKELTYKLTYYSPYNGTVIEKKVQEGMYVSEGTVIYEIADLSILWNIAEVYENDLDIIKQGGKVNLVLDSYPGETFEGKINFVYPVVNPETRTIKIRSSFINKNSKLKPNMYGNVTFKSHIGEGLLIPVDAVLITGEKNIVWVKTGENSYAPREVKLGTRVNDKYQVLSGLKEGELIAATGAYLIDSESQLRGGLSSTLHQNHDNEMNPQNESSIKNNSENLSEIWNSVCPVRGGKVNPEIQTVTYKNKMIGFCCNGCDEKFNNNPEKYLANLSEDGKEYLGDKN